jgi:hypothetical protein
VKTWLVFSFPQVRNHSTSGRDAPRWLRESCVQDIPAAKKPVTIIPDPLCHVRGLLAIAKLCWKKPHLKGFDDCELCDE